MQCADCSSVSPALPSVNRRLRVIITWEDSSPTVSEVARLRQLLPNLRHVPAQDVLMRVKAVDAWDCGEMPYGRAVDLADAAKGLGLKVYVVEDQDR
jgi:hypothetical protein